MVLDSSALVAIFKQEPGHEVLQQKINDAALVLVGAPTLLETAMVLTRLTGKDQHVLLEAYLRRIDAILVDFTAEHYSVAAEAFVRYGRGFSSKSNLNFGDCLSYAIAALAGDKLLFVGADFTHTDIEAA
ncbi:MAG: type II toxin-antitoxin system VapC family toxin [Bryobacterales bacterium]|nr:type II toxin-antitoxin system VapC family toxin [Bryobacterales bacterium]